MMDPSFGKFVFPISDFTSPSTYRYPCLGRSGRASTYNCCPTFSECALPPAGCPLGFRAQPHTKKLSEATFECSEARNPPRIANLESRISTFPLQPANRLKTRHQVKSRQHKSFFPRWLTPDLKCEFLLCRPLSVSVRIEAILILTAKERYQHRRLWKSQNISNVH